MLNCIIRLQAVVKIITNKTARTLNLLTKQSIKMHNAIYQNCLALDYLLASEGKVCKKKIKFNLNNCCSQINGFFFFFKKGCKRDHRQNEKACPSPHPDLERMRSQ
jgi:hypothetical protein